MNHQERIELLSALSRAGVSYYKSHDLEIRLGVMSQSVPLDPAQVQAGVASTPPEPIVAENADATKKMTDLIETLKLDDVSLVDKIFPAGAGL